MTVATRSSLKVHVPLRVDSEQEIVARLIEATGETRLQVEPVSIINFYVALKSKPLAILAGPARSGKIALIEEAWQPANADQVHVACLKRITPAELLGFFSEVAFQLSHGEIMQLPSIHLTEPIPYPPNLFLIGTMDTVRFDWWDADLLSKTTVIQWPAIEASPTTNEYRAEAVPDGEAEFLRSCVRSKKLARRKLDQILGWRLQPLEPLRRVKELLEKNAIHLPQSVMDEVMVYLANSWSQVGAGLFWPEIQRNVMIALDFVIAQTLLPYLGEALSQSAALIEQLGELLCGQFPRSEAFLTGITPA